jgi:hypothetical protein
MFGLTAKMHFSGANGRVFFTSSIYEVALLASEAQMINLQPLQNHYAWDLFCKEAFWKNENSNCPPELQYWAHKFVENCNFFRNGAAPASASKRCIRSSFISFIQQKPAKSSGGSTRYARYAVAYPVVQPHTAANVDAGPDCMCMSESDLILV